MSFSLLLGLIIESLPPFPVIMLLQVVDKIIWNLFSSVLQSIESILDLKIEYRVAAASPCIPIFFTYDLVYSHYVRLLLCRAG